MIDPAFVPIEELPAAVLVVGRDGSIVNANAQAGSLFGYTRNELSGLALELLIPERFRDSHGRLVEELLSKPQVPPMGVDRELNGLKSDGTEFEMEITIGPTPGDSRVVVVIRDIGARLKMREALRETEQLFQATAFHMTDLISYFDFEQDVLQWYSGDVDSLLGYEPGQVLRTLTSWWELLHPDDLERLKEAIERIIGNREETWDETYRIRAADGSYRHWRTCGTVTEFLGDDMLAGIAVIVDETERILSRKKLETALAEVEALKNRLRAESQYLQHEIKAEHNFESIIGNSGEMRATLLKVEKVAPTDATVLITGETGSGKELLARAIHSRSARSERPLIKIDCGTLPAGLIESELFGHAKGAFTGATEKRQGRFALADGGTVFLDEIGELSPDLQTKLLRVLEEGVIQPVGSEKEQQVDVRVIAVTNRNLKEEVKKGRFRSDLYYRLSVFLVESPSLRDRREDIPLLTTFFVSEFSTALGKKIQAVSQKTLDKFMSYDWPGNIRELRNVIERAVILGGSETLRVEEILGEVGGSEPSLKGDLQAVERARILRALEDSGWKIKGAGNAADRLGLKPSTLRSRMQRLGLTRP